MAPLTKEVRNPMVVTDPIKETLLATKPEKTKIFFPNLDGLRFFCFLSVFMCHIFTSNYKHIYSDPLVVGLRQAFLNGTIGVNFFFVLSGFLITFLLMAEQQTYGKVHILQFWMRRMLRIWPLYFACITFGFIVFPVLRSMAEMPTNINASPLYYLTFLGNLDVVGRQAWPESETLGVLWSVAIEEQFYFFWPILLVFVGRKWLPMLFAVIIGISWIFRASYEGDFALEHHSLSCMGDMAFGGLGAYMMHNEKVKNWVVNLSRWKIASVYVMFMGIYFFKDELLDGTYYLRIFERSIISTIILLIILEQNYAKNSLFKLSNYKTISKLGKLTYGMYCLHFMAIFVITNLTLRYHLNSEVWQVVFLEPLASLILTIIISVISYRYFESWFLRLKERFSFITK